MGKYLKMFQQHSSHTAYTEDESFTRPNVSFCVGQDEVHYSQLRMTFIGISSNDIPTYVNGVYNGNATLDNFYGLMFDVADRNTSMVTRQAVIRKDQLSTTPAQNSGVLYNFPDDNTIETLINIDAETEFVRNVYVVLDSDNVPAYAFYGTEYTSISLDGPITLGTEAFGHCPNLQGVYLTLNPPTITSHYSNYFSNTSGSIFVKYDCPQQGQEDPYDGDPNWTGAYANCVD